VAPRSPPLARTALAFALTVVFASCGGGSTGNPAVATSGATSRSAPTPTTAQQAPAPAATATTPATRRRTETAPAAAAPSTGGGAQPSGGAAAPAAGGRDSSATRSPDSSAGAADEPAPAPPASSPTTTERPDPAAPDPQPASSLLDETAELTLVERVSPAHYFQQGTVTGTYDGTMEVEARITSKGVIVRFTATLPGGTISGRGIAVAILDSATWPGLRGTAAVTGGTGRFAGIQGRRLKVTGRARPDASKARVQLAGTVTF
jgi:hypothetical protein